MGDQSTLTTSLLLPPWRNQPSKQDITSFTNILLMTTMGYIYNLRRVIFLIHPRCIGATTYTYGFVWEEEIQWKGIQSNWRLYIYNIRFFFFCFAAVDIPVFTVDDNNAVTFHSLFTSLLLFSGMMESTDYVPSLSKGLGSTIFETSTKFSFLISFHRR